MSWYNGVPMSVLFQNYAAFPAANAASAAAQNLLGGASSSFEQPNIPFGFLEQGRPGQLLTGWAAGTVTGQASATTMILTLGLNSAVNNISGTSILATAAYTVTSFSAVAWDLDFKINFRTVGYGTTTVSSSPYVTAKFLLNASTAPPTTGIVNTVIPTEATTIDASVTQWMYFTVTFSTASATNSCTCQQFLLWGSPA